MPPLLVLMKNTQFQYELNEGRHERIERFLRLSRALNLPYEKLDTLLISILKKLKINPERSQNGILLYKYP